MYDRGTKFGLQTPGSRIESILMSLPLNAVSNTSNLYKSIQGSKIHCWDAFVTWRKIEGDITPRKIIDSEQENQICIIISSSGHFCKW